MNCHLYTRDFVFAWERRKGMGKKGGEGRKGRKRKEEKVEEVSLSVTCERNIFFSTLIC